MSSREQKVVLITGASSGIGQKSAEKFAQAGYRLAVTFLGRFDEIKITEKLCRQLGATDFLAVQLNLDDDGSIGSAVKAVIDHYGKIDILVNNAGIAVDKHFSEQSREEIEAQININLLGTIKFTQAVLPHIKEMIINIGSTAAKRARIGHTVYAASKFGLRGFTQGLAQEYPNLKIYCLNPDPTATKITGFKGRSPEEVAEVVINTAEGEYELPSGSDIDVSEILAN